MTSWAPFGPPRGEAPKARRLDRLTSLRWFAALLVFGTHAYFFVRVIARWYVRSAPWAAGFGVSFFFMLSGFVLYWSHSDRAGGRPFLQNRVARIWPSHLVTLALGLLVIWRLGQPIIWKTEVPVTFLMQAWIPKYGWYFAPITPSWSLSCELFFYACFPLLRPRIDKVRDPVRLMLILIGVICVLPVLTLPLSGNTLAWALYVCPLPRLLDFVIGMLLCRIVREGRLRWTNPIPPALLTGVVIWCARYAPARWDYVAIAIIPLAWLLAASAARAAEGRRSFLDIRPLVWLGEISFAFYLTHSIVLDHAYDAFSFLHRGFISHPKVLLSVEFLACVIVAWLLHRLVEVPFERLLRYRHTARIGSGEERDGAVPADVAVEP